jgi:hypothetical protein
MIFAYDVKYMFVVVVLCNRRDANSIFSKTSVAVEVFLRHFVIVLEGSGAGLRSLQKVLCITRNNKVIL